MFKPLGRRAFSPSEMIMTKAAKLYRRTFIAGLLTLPATFASAQPAQETYPNKPVKLLVGVPPGGSTDAITRLFAAWLQENLGQPAVVENRPGANTAVAANAVVQSPPDGHTLLVASDAYISLPLLTKLQYDPFKDLIPIGTMAASPYVLVVHPSTPIHSVKDLIAHAKANPGQLYYGSSGNGGSSHFGVERFKMVTETDIVHVPYRGAGPALVDAVSGQFQVSLWTPLAATSFVKAGKLRALAVTGSKRTPSLPETPTFAEAGLPQYDHKAWFGVYAPAGTPRPIVDRVASVIGKMETSPTIKQKLEENGVEPFLSTPEQFTQMMRSESDQLAKLIKAANIKID
jgi:tripartite-type tricarboxylate transporter receptor subunit TctC